MGEPGPENHPLLLGINLGTACTAVVSSHGYRALTPSVVGYPRDIIAVRLLGKTQVFGDEALEHKSSLVLYHPLRDGLTPNDGKKDYNAAFELLRHLITAATPDQAGEIGGIIGVPARMSAADREMLQQLARQFFTNRLIISEPFLVAYQLDRLANCLLVDIGAGGVTISALKGAAPSPQDQAFLPRGGSYLDQRLRDVVNQHHPEIRISLHQARQLKEQYAFVGPAPEPVIVTLRARGKPLRYDLTDELGAICAGIVPEIVEQLTALLQGFDPEDQEEALQHIYLAGGGSRIHGLDLRLEQELGDYGPVRVSRVVEPEYAAAQGALRLAAELPPGDWREFRLADRPLETGRPATEANQSNS